MTRRLHDGLRPLALLMLLSLLLLWAPPASAEPPLPSAPSPAARWVAGSLNDRVDRLLRDAFERPLAATSELQRLLREHATDAAAQRQLLTALALVDLQAGRADRAEALAQRIDVETRRASETAPTLSAQLLRALATDARGRPEVAAAMTQALVPALSEACRSGDDCDYRDTWRALRLLARRAGMLGNTVLATTQERAGLELAEQAGDRYRQVQSHGNLALLLQRAGNAEGARRHAKEAWRLAEALDDRTLQSMVRNDEAFVADARHDLAAMLQAREEAVTLARRAGATRLEARMLANLSDAYARLRRPADALQAAERALPAVRVHGDSAFERVIVNNAGIARIGLGRIEEGKADMAHVLEMWRASAQPLREVDTLREFGEALAAAGDATAALTLYHRERKLSAGLLRADGEAALKELRSQHDAVAEQRHIELLARENALKTQQIENGVLRQRTAWLAVLPMALTIGIAALLYRRVRRTHAELSASHERLRLQSERDPLTDLANRRHFHDVMARPKASDGFEGALLLVDIDHFKQVNDRHGHAAGDRVLVEVAHRLMDAMRSDDLVVRWGGEEFLILAAHASPEQASQIAERVLQTLARQPIDVAGQALRVTASVGYARFPLPPHGLPLAWEQAVHLVDMALYLAKRDGRNRAIGIVASAAGSVQHLREVETDLEAAARDGHVTLSRTDGPAIGDDATGGCEIGGRLAPA